MTDGCIVVPYQWIRDCIDHHGRLLLGRHAHRCAEHNDMPIDETCDEWPCTCFDWGDLPSGDKKK